MQINNRAMVNGVGADRHVGPPLSLANASTLTSTSALDHRLLAGSQKIVGNAGHSSLRLQQRAVTFSDANRRSGGGEILSPSRSRQRSESYTRGAALDLLSALRSLADACKQGQVLRHGVTLRAGPYALANEDLQEIVRRRMERTLTSDSAAQLPPYESETASPNYLGEALVQDLVADALEDTLREREAQWGSALSATSSSKSGSDARRQQLRLKYQLTQIRKDRDKILAVLSASRVSMSKYAAVKEGMMKTFMRSRRVNRENRQLPDGVASPLRRSAAPTSAAHAQSSIVAWKPILTPSNATNRLPRRSDGEVKQAVSPSKELARTRAAQEEIRALRAKLDTVESQRAADEKAVTDTVRAVQLQASELKRAASFALERKDKDLALARARAAAAEDELARERRLNAAQAEIASLRDRSDAAQVSASLEKKSEQIADLVAEVTLLRQRAAEKDRTLESSAAKIAALEAALAEENTQNDSSGTSAAQLDFVLAESEARASALQDRVAETEKELEATRAERREFEARAGTLMKEVLALSKREAHREQELMSASRERDEARSSLIALKKECDQVRHRCDALESGNANKDAEELAEVRKQAEALLASQSEFENQISVLVKERDEARAKYADIQHRCDVLESGNANKDAEELAEVRKQAGALLATQSEFENQISLLVKERDEARAECAEVRHRCDALESGNANKDAEELAEVRKQAEALLATQSEFENEISLLVKERDEARAECADASRRCDALMSEHREAHDGLKGAEEQLQDAVRRRDAAVGEERKAREELRAAQEEISSLRDIIAERERELELNAGRLSDLAEADQRRLAEREEASIAETCGEVAEVPACRDADGGSTSIGRERR